MPGTGSSMRVWGVVALLVTIGCDPKTPADMATAQPCLPGAVQECYGGPPATVGVGQCRPGRRVCKPDGTGYAACSGEVLPRPPSCGGGDADCDGTPDTGCPPTYLANASDPFALAVDETHVYWTQRTTGSLLRVRKDRAEFKQLYGNELDPRGLVVDDAQLLWVTDKGVRRGPKDGSGAAENFYLTPAPFSAPFTDLHGSQCLIAPFLLNVTRDNEHVYLVTNDAICASIIRINRASRQGQGLRIGLNGGGVQLDGGQIFATSPLTRVGLDGTGKQPLDSAIAEGLALDADYVYAKTMTEVMRVRRDGSQRATLVNIPPCGGAVYYPFNLVVDRSRVYYIDGCSKSVRQVDKDGLHPAVLYAPNSCLSALALDKDSLYVANCGSGGITKMRKPE